MNGLNPNMRFKNGDYFVEDTMAPNAYVHVFLAKNPLNISETRVTVVGKKTGEPPHNFMSITEAEVLKLQRQQNVRKREQFLGW